MSLKKTAVARRVRGVGQLTEFLAQMARLAPGLSLQVAAHATQPYPELVQVPGIAVLV